MSDYKRIYLQPECCADPDVGRLWCQDDGPESCPDGEKWTPYVLASECDRLQSELEKAEARVAELAQCLDAGLEVWSRYLSTGGGSPVAHRDFIDQAVKFNDEAQRLRQQTGELEKGETSNG